MQAAANWLLEADHAQLLREQQAWERDMQQRQREQEDVELQKKMQKRLIVQKSVPASPAPVSSAASPTLLAASITTCQGCAPCTIQAPVPACGRPRQHCYAPELVWPFALDKASNFTIAVPLPCRFDLRAVSDASAGCKKGGKQQGPDLLPAPKKGQQESKLRYRDGRVVSTKGEKVIVEKVGEDWDGGSR